MFLMVMVFERVLLAIRFKTYTGQLARSRSFDVLKLDDLMYEMKDQ